MPKRGTKTKNAKAKIAAHHNAKGRGGAKKSNRVRRREAEIEARADEAAEAAAAAEAAKRREANLLRKLQQQVLHKTAHKMSCAPPAPAPRTDKPMQAQLQTRRKKRRRVTVEVA